MPVAKKQVSGKNSKSAPVKKAAAAADKAKAKSAFTREKNFMSYLYRLLKSVHPEVGISKACMETVNAIILELYANVSQEAAKFSRKTNSATLTALDVQAAAKIVLPQELGQHAITDGTTACIKFAKFKN